jgi:hypothetical protein
VERLADELTAQRSDAVVQQLQELNVLGAVNVLADGSYTFVEAVSVPETERDAVRVPESREVRKTNCEQIILSN